MRQAPPSLRTARRTRSRELSNCANGMICNTGTADRFLNSTPIDLPTGPAGSQLLTKPLKSKQFIATAAASCPLLSRNRPFNRKVRCAEATGGARPMLRGSGARYGRWRGSFPGSGCRRFCRRAATWSQCWNSPHPRPSRLVAEIDNLSRGLLLPGGRARTAHVADACGQWAGSWSTTVGPPIMRSQNHEPVRHRFVEDPPDPGRG